MLLVITVFVTIVSIRVHCYSLQVLITSSKCRPSLLILCVLMTVWLEHVVVSIIVKNILIMSLLLVVVIMKILTMIMIVTLVAIDTRPPWPRPQCRRCWRYQRHALSWLAVEACRSPRSAQQIPIWGGILLQFSCRFKVRLYTHIGNSHWSSIHWI